MRAAMVLLSADPLRAAVLGCLCNAAMLSECVCHLKSWFLIGDGLLQSSRLQDPKGQSDAYAVLARARSQVLVCVVPFVPPVILRELGCLIKVQMLEEGGDAEDVELVATPAQAFHGQHVQAQVLGTSTSA